MCTMFMPGALRDLKRALEHMELARDSFTLSFGYCEQNLVPLQQLQVF